MLYQMSGYSDCLGGSPRGVPCPRAIGPGRGRRVLGDLKGKVKQQKDGDQSAYLGYLAYFCSLSVGSGAVHVVVGEWVTVGGVA